MTTGDPSKLVLELIDKQLAVLETFTSQLGVRLPIWRNRTISLLSDYVFEGELRVLSEINEAHWDADKRQFQDFLLHLREGIQNSPDYYLVPREPLAKSPRVQSRGKRASASTAASRPDRHRVFVVHGHDSLAKLEVTRTLEQLGLEAIVLHEQANEGRTIIEKFERNAETVDFAVIVLTPDDSGHAANKPDERRPRARQNVILELGYFCAALGRSRVCVLFKGDVEVPSDYLGVVYTPLDSAGAWKLALVKELKSAGIKVDLNTIT